MIPTTTGAARSVGKIIPDLDGKLDGLSLRVPVPAGSIVDLVTTLDESVTIESVNAAFKAAADGANWDRHNFERDPVPPGA